MNDGTRDVLTQVTGAGRVGRRAAIGSAVAAAAGLATRPWALPLAVAQEATPAPVTAPQELMPKGADYGTGTTAKINGVDIYYEVYGRATRHPPSWWAGQRGSLDERYPGSAGCRLSGHRDGQPWPWPLVLR